MLGFFIIKTKFLLSHAKVTVADFGCTVWTLWFCCSQTLLNCLSLRSFDFGGVWWGVVPEVRRARWA